MPHKTFIVQVKAGAKEERIEETEGILKVWTKEPAKEGRANKAVRRLVAEYFHLGKSGVEIKTGFKSRRKIIRVYSR